MKKRRIKRWINVEPYQYLALQKYLNQMEKKGWKLVSVFGSSSCRLTFEKNEDTDTEYYIVDYTKDYSALTPETETEKSLDMNMLVLMEHCRFIVQILIKWYYVKITKRI